MATWVLVDDSDPNFTFGNDGWAALTPNTTNPTDANITLAEDGTVHFLRPNVTSGFLEYNFTGTQIALFGPALIFNITTELENGLNVTIKKPVWDCTVDGKAISNKQPYGNYPLQSYCEADGLSDGQHTVALSITANGDTGFFFDYLRYQVPEDKLNTVSPNATAWFDASDPRLEFQQEWDDIGSGKMTKSQSEPIPIQESQFFMNFNGTSVIWRALSKAAIERADPSLPALLMGKSTTLSGWWVIDGHTPSDPFIVDLANFTVDDNGNPYSTILFDTSGFPVPAGPHNLTVFYDGNSTVWPLTFDFLTVSNAFPEVTTSGSASTPSGATSKDSSNSGTIGGAVGGVLGGLLVLGLGLYLYRRWQVQQRQKKTQILASNLEHNNIQLHQFE